MAIILIIITLARIWMDTAEFAHPYDGNQINKFIKIIIAQSRVVIALSRVMVIALSISCYSYCTGWIRLSIFLELTQSMTLKIFYDDVI